MSVFENKLNNNDIKLSTSGGIFTWIITKIAYKIENIVH